MIAEPTGTDRCRVLCHQFSTSSLLLLASSISRSNRCALMMKHMTLALLQLLVNGDRGRHTWPTVFPLQSGRLYCIVFWSRRNRSERWQLLMVSPMKWSIASFVLRRKCIYSKKSNGPICRDGYARHVFLLCSRTDPLRTQHHSSSAPISFRLRRVIPTAVNPLQTRRLGCQGPSLACGDTESGLTARDLLINDFTSLGSPT
jgi:hypothetical protein